MAVEFRNLTWLNEAYQGNTLEFLRELGAAYVVVDSPQRLSNTVPSVWAIINTRLAVVRLHGQNAETWNIKGATSALDRFNYDYADADLAAQMPDIRALERRVELLQVILKYNFENQGRRNAAKLIKMLQGQA